MTKLGAAFWLVLVVTAGFTTFKVKYAVQDIEDELNRVRKHAIAEQQEIRVLTAEWTYLNQPERLAELNRRFLGLTPLSARQLQRGVGELPLRPPAPPDVVVAANPEPVPPLAAAPAPAPIPPPAQLAVSASLPIAPASLHDPVPRPTAPLRLATAGKGQTAESLDALIAQIAETR